MSFNKNEELTTKYNELLDLVINKTEDSDKLLAFKETYNNKDLELIVSKFCKDLEKDYKNFKLFINRNDRIFRSKIGIKIIPSVNLKLLLEKDEGYMWECIQLIYAIYRSNDETKKINVQKVVESIEKFNFQGNNSNKKSQEDEPIHDSSEQNQNSNENYNDNSNGNGNGNGNVDNMVMDIADTLRDNMVSASKGSQKVNPIENMIKTSQMISDKYGSKLKSGQISMNDMFQSLGRMMGEIDKKTSNDEELKKVEIDDMPNPEDMMNELGIDTKGFNPMEMINEMLNKKKEKNDLTPEQVKEMEDFYANIKTEDLLLENNDKNGEDKLNKINEKLMQKLPEDKKKELEKITKTLSLSL